LIFQLKKTVSILLSFLIFLSSSGYILIYVERLANNKEEIRSIINAIQNKSDLLKLRFTKSEYSQLNWRDEKEFELEGNLYDVARTETTDNEVFVYCLHDENEEMLVSNYENLYRCNSVNDKILSGSQTSTLNIQLLAIQNDLFLLKRMTDVVLFSENYFNNYHSIYLQFPTPPPKLV
jgi:hypothetical protein